MGSLKNVNSNQHELQSGTSTRFTLVEKGLGSRLVARLLCVSLKEDGTMCSSRYQAFHLLQEKPNRIKITVNS